MMCLHLGRAQARVQWRGVFIMTLDTYPDLFDDHLDAVATAWTP